MWRRLGGLVSGAARNWRGRKRGYEPDGDRMDSAALTVLTSPQRFRDANGPQWDEYADALTVLDKAWRGKRFRNTSFGVIGPRPSWEDTIARGAALFEMSSWSQLDDEQASMIAPTHFFADGDALLGSIGRRVNNVRSFLSEPARAGDRDRILSLLRDARSLSARSVPVVGGEILAEMCEVPGIGRAFATRLLTLSRPDAFVVVNNKSAEWLRLATGLTLTGKRRSYRHLLEWLDRQDWHRAAEPSESLGRRLWRIRAALLDAFAYQPWS